MSESNHIYGLTHVADIVAHAPAQIQRLWLEPGQSTDALAGQAAQAGVVVVRVERAKLVELAGDRARHAVAELRPFDYVELDDLLAGCGPAAVVLALDSVTDPGNLGAILRSARFFGVAGVILPKDRSVLVNATVLKRSAGAALGVPIARVTNLSRSLRALKKHEFWIYGSVSTGGVAVSSETFAPRSCLVLGAEGAGIRPGVLKECDESLTLSGQWESLNVASFAAVLLHEATRIPKSS